MKTYLTIPDVANMLQLTEQTIRRYVLNDEIPYFKIKKVIRFRLSDIERWVELGGAKQTTGESQHDEPELFDLDDEGGDL